MLNNINPNQDIFAGKFYREHCLYHPEIGVYNKEPLQLPADVQDYDWQPLCEGRRGDVVVVKWCKHFFPAMNDAWCW